MAFDISSSAADGVATITLGGELDAGSAPIFKKEVEKVAAGGPRRVVLLTSGLSFMASAGLRVLIFAKQKLGTAVDIYVVAAQEAVIDTLQKTGFHHSVYLVDQPPA
jgi:anti-anti-sigma factor